eukprot:Skav206977  [mRNA]  locus=scaffold1394:26773:27129:+ [translate_table: standard]
MFFQGINALPGDLRIQLAGVVKVPSVHNVILSRSLLNFHTDCVSAAGHAHTLLIVLNASNMTNGHIALVWDAQRCSNTKLTTNHLTSQNQGILFPENVLLVDLQHHREDGHFACLGLL